MNKVEAVLSDGSSTLKKWEEPHKPDLGTIVETIKHIKGGVNDYLTCLITADKGLITKCQMEYSYSNEQGKMENDGDCDDEYDSEGIQEVKISGPSVSITAVNDHQSSRNEKRKSNFYNEIKKFKKL